MIADNAELKGTVRSFTKEIQALLKSRMEEICEGSPGMQTALAFARCTGVSKSFNVECKLDFIYVRVLRCTRIDRNGFLDRAILALVSC